MSAPARAAIDIGTNSTNLLIVDGDGHRERWVTVTRLGKDVDQRRFDPEAVERTLATLREYRARIDERNVTDFRVAATSGARRRGSRRRPGAFAEVLDTAPSCSPARKSGSRFAATSDLHRELAPFLVVDIGGGSTELVLGTDDPQATVSMDVGAVRLTEAELHGDPPAPDELANALAVAQAHLEARCSPCRPWPRRAPSSASPARSPPSPRSRSACRPTIRS